MLPKNKIKSRHITASGKCLQQMPKACGNIHRHCI